MRISVSELSVLKLAVRLPRSLLDRERSVTDREFSCEDP